MKILSLLLICFLSFISLAISFESPDIAHLAGKMGKIKVFTNGSLYESSESCFVNDDKELGRIHIVIVDEDGQEAGGPEFGFYYGSKTEREKKKDVTIYRAEENKANYESLCDGSPVPLSIKLSKSVLEVTNNSVRITKKYYCAFATPPETIKGENTSEVLCAF